MKTILILSLFILGTVDAYAGATIATDNGCGGAVGTNCVDGLTVIGSSPGIPGAIKLNTQSFADAINNSSGSLREYSVDANGFDKSSGGLLKAAADNVGSVVKSNPCAGMSGTCIQATGVNITGLVNAMKTK